MRGPSVVLEETTFERHFTPKQLAELWVLDESTIRRMFMDEPGVMKYDKASRRDGRRRLRHAPHTGIRGAARL